MGDSSASRHLDVSPQLDAMARMKWHHRPVICWLLTLWLLTGSLAAQSVPGVSPSQVIVLADWGMSNVSEIGYLHVGVAHGRRGETLAVYTGPPTRP